MPRRRDRHGRGIRGPLAAPNPLTGAAVPLHRPARADYFKDCVREAMVAIAAVNPEALDGILIGVDEVPQLNVAWSGDRVPLSAAVEPTRTRRAQIIVFQRPLEHRCASRGELRRLVHRTIVEQLSTLTGRSIADLAGDDPDWD